MCLALIAFKMHPDYPLILAGNRDEFYERPTAAASFWREAPQLLAGRDLVHGGTWLGVTRRGALATLTNYRDPQAQVPRAPSRGGLVAGFLTGSAGADHYLAHLRRRAADYQGYNLLFGNRDRLLCYSNVSDQARDLAPGCYGLSNHLLDSPWPKVVRGRSALARVVASGSFEIEELFAILSDRTQAPDRELPDTGVGLEWERLLSSIFIVGEDYGTRCSTVVLVDREGGVTFAERSFERGEFAGEVRESFFIEG